MPRERISHGHLMVVSKDPRGLLVKGPDGGPDAVTARGYVPDEDLREDEILVAEPSFDLSWRGDENDGWVQIAVELDPTWLARRIAEAKPGEPLTVYSDVLGRREVNNLIRTARRARNAAYGSDE